jgi:hypothetical protein
VGFPLAESSVRILSKVIPEAAAVWPLRRLPLRDAKIRKLLAHTQTINAGHLYAAAHLKTGRGVSLRLFEEIAQDHPQSNAMRHRAVLRHTLSLLEKTSRPIRTFDSLAQLQRTHEALVRQTGSRCEHCAGYGPRAFPAPPVLGTAHIEPLSSVAAMDEEGAAMNHCVARYAREVLAGRAFFYRSLAPERVTIGIARGGEGWSLFAIRGHGNAEPRPGTVAAVSEWLASASNCSRRATW